MNNTERIAGYREILARCRDGATESKRNAAYEFGRAALAEDVSLLEIVYAHHQALASLGPELPDPEAAGHCLVECLTPYEMNHRGAQDGYRALRRLNFAMEDEVRRIAHAVHDEAGQLLASVHIALADLGADLPAHSRGRLREIGGLLERVEQGLRDLSHELRPTILDHLGLAAALDLLAELSTRRHGLRVAVRCGDEDRLPAEVEVVLYRVVQEALNNVAKHARAKRVDVILQRVAGRVRCEIRDDGMGLPSSQPAGHGIGLLAMRERLAALGGTLRLDSRPRHGTTVRAELILAGHD